MFQIKFLKFLKKKKYRIGFYGSTTKNLANLSKKIKNKYKNLNIIYTHSPPFKPIKSFQKKKISRQINNLKIDILFVFLGCPKQELWMYENKKELNCIMIGAGAVVDFLSGNKTLPNKFFEYLGLAWFIRLLSEPKRLFWRYFSTNFLFIYLFFLQIFNIKKFK